MTRLIAAAGLMAACAAMAEARPVSYQDAWTVIGEHDREMTALWAHYTPHRSYSLGYRGEWHREQDMVFQGAQATWLVNRWFAPDSQGNLYLFGAGGLAYGVDGNPMDTSPAGSVGLMADWETRRVFVSYMGRAFAATDGTAHAMHAARAGFAPYVANTGELHTWLMLQVDHAPEAGEPVGVTPLVRVFQGPVLFELGWTVNAGKPLVNLTYRF